MIGTKTTLALVLVGSLALTGADPLPQEELVNGYRLSTQEESYVFEIAPEGVKFEDFLDMVSKVLDRSICYDSRRLNGQNKTIKLVGRHEVPKADARRVIEEIMLAHNMAMLPMSSRPDSIILVEDIQTSQLLKQRARSIKESEIAICEDRPGGLFLCVVPLEHLKATECQRALNNMIQEHRACFVHPVESVNSVVICGFGNFVTTLYATIQEMEAAAQSEKTKNYRQAQFLREAVERKRREQEAK